MTIDTSLLRSSVLQPRFVQLQSTQCQAAFERWQAANPGSTSRDDFVAAYPECQSWASANVPATITPTITTVHGIDTNPVGVELPATPAASAASSTAPTASSERPILMSNDACASVFNAWLTSTTQSFGSQADALHAFGTSHAECVSWVNAQLSANATELSSIEPVTYTILGPANANQSSTSASQIIPMALIAGGILLYLSGSKGKKR